ncbi:MAG: DUF362 domain-containing protein [Candidatus Latescibacteria bacterium]|nr:DUF362 domain-containing protein [Candidatus Latescibacterota bacterium]
MLSRRAFLATAAQAGGLMALGGLGHAADNFAVPDPAPKARVVLVKTNDRATGIGQALKLFGANPVRGKTVALKPNFNSAHRFPGSTHDTTLRTLVAQFAEMGARAITVADRSGMGNTRAVMEEKGVFALGKTIGFETVVLNELPASRYTHHQSKDWHWQRGFDIPTLFHEAGAVVQTCCLKTHQYGGHFTLSLKNSVGMVARDAPKSGYEYMRELHSSSYQRQMIAEINQAYAPDLVVLDGMEAFVDGGPHDGTRKQPGVIIVGTDRVAVDAVGVAILRMHGGNRTISAGRIFEQVQIKRAVELGLGVRDPSQIDLVTGDAASAASAAQVRQALMAG